MIRRLLIVLSIAVGIVFVPYFFGVPIVKYVFNNEWDEVMIKWMWGFLGIMSLIVIGLIIIWIIDIIKYIIKG